MTTAAPAAATTTADRRARQGRTRGRLHPLRPAVPFGMSVAALVGWGLVAHNSGSGWVQFLGEAVGATLAVGLAGPALALARARVECVTNVGDATAGEPAVVVLRSPRRTRIRPVDPPGPDAFTGPSWDPSAPSEVRVVPAYHGVLSHVVVDVQSAAPFGIVWWSRRQVVALAAPLHVAPRIGPARPVPSVAEEGSGDGKASVAAVVGEVRGARPYRPGDSRRRVHWPATAHSGALMVREMEAPVRRPAVVTVTLPADADAAERVAEEGLGTVLALLWRGVPVTLVTTEVDGVADAAVAHRLAAGRRLARAVPSAGGEGRTVHPGVVVDGAPR